MIHGVSGFEPGNAHHERKGRKEREERERERRMEDKEREKIEAEGCQCSRQLQLQTTSLPPTTLPMCLQAMGNFLREGNVRNDFKGSTGDFCYTILSLKPFVRVVRIVSVPHPRVLISGGRSSRGVPNLPSKRVLSGQKDAQKWKSSDTHLVPVLQHGHFFGTNVFKFHFHAPVPSLIKSQGNCKEGANVPTSHCIQPL